MKLNFFAIEIWRKIQNNTISVFKIIGKKTTTTLSGRNAFITSICAEV